MAAQTLRISPGSGLNVDPAMPCARPVRPAWSGTAPASTQFHIKPLGRGRASDGVRIGPGGDAAGGGADLADETRDSRWNAVPASIHRARKQAAPADVHTA